MAELDRAGPERDETGVLGGRQRGELDAEPASPRARAVRGRRCRWSRRGAAPAARPRRARPTRRRNAPEILAETSTGAPAGASASSSASRPSSSSASGLPAVASCSRAAASGASQSSSDAASSRLRPPIRSVGRSAPSSSDGSPSRTATSTAIGSAISRRQREQQRLGARAVEPLGVVDQHRDRALLGVRGEQAERRRADREPILGLRPGRSASAPRARPPAAPGCGRAAPSAGRSSSSSDANGICASDSIPRARSSCIPSRPLGGVVEQRGLADPRLADERQRRALARPRALRAHARSARRSARGPRSMARFSGTGPLAAKD